MNPIGYDLLYDFSDKSVVQGFINDTRSMKAAYEEFVQVVIGGQLASLAKQEEELAKKIREAADASVQANITHKATQETLLQQAAAIADLTKQLELLKSTRQSTKLVEDAAANSVDGLTKRLNEQLAEYRRLDPAVDSNLQRLTTLSNGIRQTREAITQLTNETRITTQTFTAAKGSYQALEQETKQLVRDLKSLEGGLDANNTRAKELQKTIYDNTARLKAFDAQMNQNFRNVGNYGSAIRGASRQFDGLGNSIQQIGRELPSVAVSINTFFLAISNNLPILFDELSRTKLAIQESKAAALLAADAAALQAKETALATGALQAEAVALGNQARAQALANAEANAAPSIGKRVLSSIFSVNTALTLAVVALTLFGGKIIDAFTGASAASKAAAEALKKYKEQLQQIDDAARGAAAAEIAHLKALNAVATDTTLNLRQRTEAANEMQKLYPQRFAALRTEAILEGQAAAAIGDATKAIIARARAAANEKKLAAAVDNQGVLQGQFDKAKKELEDYTKFLETNATVSLAKLRSELGRPLTFKEIFDDLDQDQDDTIFQNNLKKRIKAYNTFRDALVKSGVEIEGFARGVTDELKKVGDGFEQFPKGSLGAYKKQVADLNAQLEYLVKDSDEYNKVLKERDRIQAIINETKFKDPAAEARKATAALKKEESEYQKQLRMRLQIIDANEKAELAEADLAFQGTRKTIQDEIAFEEERLAIITKFANQKLALYPKDTKQYIDANSEKTKAEADELEKIKDLREKYRKQDLEAVENFNERLQKIRDSARELMETETSRKYSQAENIIQLRVISGDLTQPQGEKALFELRKKQQEELIALDRKKYLASVAGSEEEVAAKKQLNADELQSERDTINEELRLRELATKRRVELTNFISDFVTTVAQGIFEANQQSRDNELTELSQQKDYELKLAGDNKIAQQKINDNYARKEAELKTKQAQQAKNEALFNIAISTAEAVAKSVAASPTTFGLPFSAFALALGIAQAAVVSARPLPKYRFGRGKGKTEYAEVNDGPGFEFIERNGELRIEGGGRRTVTKLDSQDRVYTHRESINILNEDFKDKKASDSWMNSLLTGTGVYMRAEERKNERFAAALASGMDHSALASSFKDAVQGIPIQINTFDENGHRNYTKRKNTLIENVNKRQKLGGNG